MRVPRRGRGGRLGWPWVQSGVWSMSSPCDPYRQALTMRPSLKAPTFSFLNYSVVLVRRCLRGGDLDGGRGALAAGGEGGGGCGGGGGSCGARPSYSCPARASSRAARAVKLPSVDRPLRSLPSGCGSVRRALAWLEVSGGRYRLGGRGGYRLVGGCSWLTCSSVVLRTSGSCSGVGRRRGTGPRLAGGRCLHRRSWGGGSGGSGLRRGWDAGEVTLDGTLGTVADTEKGELGPPLKLTHDQL